jgi:hypothetical protein
VDINGVPILRASLRLPRVGVWHADVVAMTDQSLADPVVLSSVEGLTLRGSIVRSGVWAGWYHLRVAGGAGRLPTALPAKPYEQVTADFVVRDVLIVGETLSNTSDRGVLATTLPRWTRTRGPAGAALGSIVAAICASWRVLPDGSVWIGIDTFPELTSTPYFTELEEAPHLGRAVLGVEDPWLVAGVTFLGRKVSYVVHTVDARGARTEVFFE